MRMSITVLLAVLAAPLALGSDLIPGKRLPDLRIDERGELVLQGEDVGYAPWVYPQSPGKVHVLQYLAATRAASNINKPFTDRMKTDLPQGAFLSTTILNLDEAMWGTGSLVVGELKSNKRQFPNAILVADEDGNGLRQWQLEKENSAVIVTDPEGIVLYFKQGAMTPAEVESALELIRQHITADPEATATLAAGSVTAN